MKKIITALALTLLLTMTMGISAVAFSSGVLNSPNYSYNNNGLKYVEKSTTDNGYSEKIFYGEYNPTAPDAEYEWVLHKITNDSGTVLSTVMDIAKNYENATGRKVMLATNGDFFVEGEPVDSYVVDGEVVKMGTYTNKNSFGFDNEGKVAIGRMTVVEPMLKVFDADGNSTLLKIDNINSPPSEGEISIYTNAGTYNFSNVGVTQVKTDSTNFNSYPVLGTEYTTTTKGVRSGDFSFTLRSGRYIIVYTSAHEDIFKTYSYGREIDMIGTPAGNYEGCKWVIGGYDVLVNNGVVGTSFHTDNSGNVNRARTFIGSKADGTIFVCVVDETNGSSGITVSKEAELAKALGAQYALELDGGGSSTMIVRINDTLTLRNKPSDGSMRRVANAVLLVEKEKPHQCEHVCEECGKCTDTACQEAVCADKCEGHIPVICNHEYDNCVDEYCNICGEWRKAPGHYVVNCEDTTCPVCGNEVEPSEHAYSKCTDTSCYKCDYVREQGAHTYDDCLDVECNVCGTKREVGAHTYDGELDDVCNVCGNVRELPHCCDHVCDQCGKCTDAECDDEACADKCQGHKVEDNTTPPSAPAPKPEEPKKTGIAAFFAAIFEAIRKFFASLFG